MFLPIKLIFFLNKRREIYDPLSILKFRSHVAYGHNKVFMVFSLSLFCSSFKFLKVSLSIAIDFTFFFCLTRRLTHFFSVH